MRSYAILVSKCMKKKTLEIVIPFWYMKNGMRFYFSSLKEALDESKGQFFIYRGRIIVYDPYLLS